MNCKDSSETHKHNPVIRWAVPARPLDTRIVCPVTAGAEHSTFHATATPRPILMFAIASDEFGVKPSDQIGPWSALAFTLMNDRLRHKIDIVKTLLAYGADPALLKNPMHYENFYCISFVENVKLKVLKNMDSDMPCSATALFPQVHWTNNGFSS
jgi:hypothetical protein